MPELVVIDAVTGRCNRYAYAATDRVRRLKRLIEDKEGIPPDQQRLVLDGEIMEDNTTIAFYTQFRDKVALLQLVGAMQIFVHFPTKTITLNARASDTVGQLKHKLFEIDGVPSSLQRLFFADVVLDDDTATLSDYNIQNESALPLLILSSSGSSSS